jgi:hypothetical protein
VANKSPSDNPTTKEILAFCNEQLDELQVQTQLFMKLQSACLTGELKEQVEALVAVVGHMGEAIDQWAGKMRGDKDVNGSRD